jgi:hypothetical protein
MTTWTKEETEVLADHFQAGVSALDSAIALAETFAKPFTKNMVIGRRRRIGLVYGASAPEVARINSARALAKAENTEAGRAKRTALEAHRAAKREQIEKEKLAKKQRVEAKKERPVAMGWPYRQPAQAPCRKHQRSTSTTMSPVTRDAVMSLQAHHCKYPMGVVGDPSFKFCCKPRENPSSYCTEHRSICTVQIEPKSQMLAARV